MDDSAAGPSRSNEEEARVPFDESAAGEAEAPDGAIPAIPESSNSQSRPPPDAPPPDIPVGQGVNKRILKSGYGEKPPPPNATCFVHYRAWVDGGNEPFHDTWQEQQRQEMVIGHAVPPHLGLSLGVSSMVVGERCLLSVPCQLAYGQEGCFSFPHVPGGADVIYEVALVGVDEAKEALAYMGEEFMLQMFGKYIDMANAVRFPCHLNLAQCCLKREEWQEAINHCNVVLVEEPRNEKALFRRGKARAALGQSDAAKEDLEKAKLISPGDRSVAKELRQIRELENEGLKEQRKLFRGMFKEESGGGAHRVERGGEGGGIGHHLVSWLLFFWGVVKNLFGFRALSTQKKLD